MLYESTRGGKKGVSSAEAIKTGIAPDGGLFVPESIPRMSPEDMESLINMSYQQRAVRILQMFLGDYTREELEDCVNNAYTAEKFGSNAIAPVYKLNDTIYMLELWHGPTCAFKDMALQLLPRLLVRAVHKTGETAETVILVATSGDTGKAALEGFKNVRGTRVIVFYPENGVSEIQKLQMVTQEGENVASVAVRGNFDDAQNGVKSIFGDGQFAEVLRNSGFRLSSANSINWGRLVPQIIYYFSAYADMVKCGEIKPGENINIVVPTGNFGNILAAYYAKVMGLPVRKLICASNENNVLTDFIRTGVYDRRRDFKRTISPSMDILISSNLERLLYEATDRNGEQVVRWMEELRLKGTYKVDEDTFRKISHDFWSDFTNDSETLKTIEYIYNEYRYVIDTHTAVGIDVYDKYVISTVDFTKTLIASTASPFKFNRSVAKAVFGEEAINDKSEFELLEMLASVTGPVPPGLKDLDKRKVLHERVCESYEMKNAVEDILGLA